MAIMVAGGPELLGTLAFGQKDQRLVNFLENQFTQATTHLSQAGHDFMNRSRQLFEQFNGAEAMQLAKAALRTISHAFTPNIIQPLTTIASVQQAPSIMQRWIMACPEVRTLYQQQLLDGYSHAYLDVEPGLIGENHYDYRAVMDGIVVESENEEYDWKVTHYFDDRTEDPVLLKFTDQVDIITTWDAVRSMLEFSKEDPTSIYCDMR